MSKQRDTGVTDAEIQQIIDQNEAGIADLIAAYDSVEHHYYAAAHASTAREIITYDSNTAA